MVGLRQKLTLMSIAFFVLCDYPAQALLCEHSIPVVEIGANELLNTPYGKNLQEKGRTLEVSWSDLFAALSGIAESPGQIGKIRQIHAFVFGRVFSSLRQVEAERVLLRTWILQQFPELASRIDWREVDRLGVEGVAWNHWSRNGASQVARQLTILPLEKGQARNILIDSMRALSNRPAHIQKALESVFQAKLEVVVKVLTAKSIKNLDAEWPTHRFMLEIFGYQYQSLSIKVVQSYLIKQHPSFAIFARSKGLNRESLIRIFEFRFGREFSFVPKYEIVKDGLGDGTYTRADFFGQGKAKSNSDKAKSAGAQSAGNRRTGTQQAEGHRAGGHGSGSASRPNTIQLILGPGSIRKRLGLAESATAKEVKRRLQKLRFEFHPDRNSQPIAQDVIRALNAMADQL